MPTDQAAASSLVRHASQQLSTDGYVAFCRRQGSAEQRRFGRVSASRVRALVAALRRTDFPAQTQTSFVPGWVCVLTLESPKQRVLVGYFDAIKLDAYRDVLQAFTELTLAFADGQHEKLSTWNFIASDSC